jgi:DNA-binding PadR family transcriptional regulator
MANSFNHLVEIDEEAKRLTIYRIYEDGRKELYTHVDMPISSEGDKEKFQNFSQLLGENLLIDSPVARRLLNL